MDKTKTFEALKTVLAPYKDKLLVVSDNDQAFSINTKPDEKKEKGEFFAAIQINKNYVSFHLMPVYYYPELLKNISVNLRKRMQGKSCFNFSEPDSAMLKELSSLTKSSFQKYESVKKIR
jgi:hypothetical protein